MRVEAPKRPPEDVNAAAMQQWRWMYKLSEQLNMMIEQLERANILDLSTPGFGSAATNGLLSGSVEDHSEEIAALKEAQTAQAQTITELQEADTEMTESIDGLASSLSTTNKALDVVEAQLGGYTILIGTGTASFGTGNLSVTIKFGKTFKSRPVVVTNQVFDEQNTVCKTTDITTTQFKVSTPGGFTSSGTRAFSWIAIGKLA